MIVGPSPPRLRGNIAEALFMLLCAAMIGAAIVTSLW
jgi:hypothetical protein